MKKIKNKRETVSLDEVDQANLNLHFIEALVDMLFSISGHGHIDELKNATISAMCSEAGFKIESIKKFIESVPVSTKETRAAKA